MLDFFEAASCLSVKLAHYFGEDLDFKNCGHCSVCKGNNDEHAIFRKQQTEIQAQMIKRHDFQELNQEFTQSIAEKFSVINLAKFLCGIDAPYFRQIKAKQMTYFGRLENYPFATVKNWIEQNNAT